MESSEWTKSLSVIIDKCLCISPDDELLVIFDDSFAAYSASFWRVIGEHDISATFVYIPKPYQMRLAGKIISQPSVTWIPKPISIGIHSSTAIINLLDGDLATSAVRRAIIQHPRTRECRLAHIPGISNDVLSILKDSDFSIIEDLCEALAWALGNAHKARLISYDANNLSYVLKMDLGGWDNEPMISPGIIRAGSWGNVPPGETFCCPNPDTVNGEICINGSVPGIVLKQGEDLILTFEAGQLTAWRAVSSSPACAFFERQRAAAQTKEDHNWNVFCELGIGVNSAIKALTGNSLFDEKALGTVHVAIGDNTTFGRNVKSHIHADLATWHPDLIVDDFQIISKGTINLCAIQRARDDWMPDLEERPLSQTVHIKDAEVQEEGRFLRRRLYSAGRLGLLKMHNDETSVALAALYKFLVCDDGVRLEYLLSEHPSFKGISTGHLLALLSHYRCVTYS